MPKYKYLCPKHCEIECYSGCPFGCLYCVEQEKHTTISQPIAKPIEICQKLQSNNSENYPVYLSPQTDAYQPLESTTQLTQTVLKAIPITTPFFVITKSPLVLRDTELFQNRNAFIAISLNCCDESIISRLEPGAPSAAERLELVNKLVKIPNLKTVVKIDPILPGITDGEKLDDLLEAIIAIRPFAVTAETARLNKALLTRLQTGLNTHEFSNLSCFYYNTKDEPIHPPMDYRLSLFQHILKKLSFENIPVSFCRATVPDSIATRDCRGGFQ